MKRQILIFILFSSCLYGLTQAERPQLYYRSDYTINEVRYGDPWEVGNKFVTGSEPPIITALGFIDLHNTNPAIDPDGDGLLEEHRVTLWLESDSSVVTEVIVPAGTDGQLVGSFRYAAIPEGVITLEANTAYVVSAKHTNMDEPWLEEEALTPDYYFIGENINDSTTWEPRWGTGGGMPDKLWHTGYFYGNVNILGGVSAAAFEPVPEDGAIGVGYPVDTAIEVSMSWKTGLNQETQEVNFDITAHYLYITDANSFDGVSPIVIPAGSPTQPGAEYTLTGADYDTTYYWRVDESVNDSASEDPNTIVGAVWTFTTLPRTPLIIDQPEDTIVAPGETASFSITATGPDPMSLSYQWYQSEDNIADPQTDTLLTGEETDTFLLSNAQPADAGMHYFCVVTNIEGSAISETAFLEVKRLMGWWKLDSDLTDSSDNGWDGTLEDPNFADGILGQAQEFFRDGRFTEIAGSGEAFNNYDMAGMTVSAWIKTASTGWLEFASKQYINPDPWQQLGWVMGLDNNGAPYFEIRGSATTYPTTTPVNDNQWHLLTASFDKDTGIVSMYIDGELEKAGSPSSGSIEMTDRELIFGAGENTGNTPYEGLLDDVRIWNYPKNAWDAIDLYNEIIEPDKMVCIEEYSAAVDVSGPAGIPDCKIDMYDLVEVITGWLECGLHPVCD